MHWRHIRKRRLDLNLRQIDAARLIGCDEISVVNWERGHAQPAICYLTGIVGFMGFNPLPKGDAFAQTFVNHGKSFGMTQRRFAAQIGVDPGNLSCARKNGGCMSARAWTEDPRHQRCLSGGCGFAEVRPVRLVSVLLSSDSVGEKFAGGCDAVRRNRGCSMPGELRLASLHSSKSKSPIVGSLTHSRHTSRILPITNHRSPFTNPNHTYGL